MVHPENTSFSASNPPFQTAPVGTYPDAIAAGEIGNLGGRQRAGAARDFDFEGGPGEIERRGDRVRATQRKQTEREDQAREFGDGRMHAGILSRHTLAHPYALIGSCLEHATNARLIAA